jgi:hypothetical protein
MNTFQLTRIYSDDAGDSHFEDVNIDLIDRGKIGFLSETQLANGIIFREVIESYDYDFHTAPQKQYLIMLDGEIEIETSSGEVRRFQGGNILLLEDISGKGHRTRNITQVKRRSVFIPIP